MNTFVILLLFVLLILISLLISELVKQAKEIDALHIIIEDQEVRIKEQKEHLRSSLRYCKEPTKKEKQPLNNP
ncbi:MAG: hypothetical protein K6E61_03295 [Bacteroidales bacterium]|nr:hypothetical protein [Bacteroidales bacterium]